MAFPVRTSDSRIVRFSCLGHNEFATDQAAILLLAQARELKTLEPCPTAAQHQVLLVSEGTPEEEMALQLVVVLSRWGLLEINGDDDRKAFIDYLCKLQSRSRPEVFVTAAEEALSLLFTNWVMPQDWGDFRRYAKQTAWALYAKGIPPKHTTLDWIELEAERIKWGKRGQRARATHLSVTELAQVSQTDPRRIYEAIKAQRLPAAKFGRSLRIETAVATEFILKSKQKQEIATLKKHLLQLGHGNEAVRKRIYRLRKTGLSGREVIEYLTRSIPKRRRKRTRDSQALARRSTR